MSHQLYAYSMLNELLKLIALLTDWMNLWPSRSLTGTYSHYLWWCHSTAIIHCNIASVVCGVRHSLCLIVTLCRRVYLPNFDTDTWMLKKTITCWTLLRTLILRLANHWWVWQIIVPVSVSSKNINFQTEFNPINILQFINFELIFSTFICFLYT